MNNFNAFVEGTIENTEKPKVDNQNAETQEEKYH